MFVFELDTLLGPSVDSSEARDSSAWQRMVPKSKPRLNWGRPYATFRGANLANGYMDQLCPKDVVLRLIPGSALWRQAVEAALGSGENQYLFYDCGENELH